MWVLMTLLYKYWDYVKSRECSCIKRVYLELVLSLSFLPFIYTATLTLNFSLGVVLWREKELILAPSVPDVDKLQNDTIKSGATSKKISVAYRRLSWFDFLCLCHLNRQPDTRTTVSRRTTTAELSIPARAPELIVQPRAPHSLKLTEKSDS